MFKGKLEQCEDNMNCQLSNVSVYYRDGRSGAMQNVFIRGSKIKFLIFPDMLANAPMFKVPPPFPTPPIEVGMRSAGWIKAGFH